MKLQRLTTVAVALPLVLTVGSSAAHAVDEDGPIFAPPHGMLLVELDKGTNKLFATDGIGGLSGQTTTNMAGQTILFNALTPADPDSSDDFIPIGGIAERTFFDPTKPFDEQVQAAADAGASQPFPVATRDGDVASTPPVFVSDDPGFFTQNDDTGGTAVPIGTQLSVNFYGPLRYYDPVTGAWTAPPSGERMRVFDLDEVEGLAFREQAPLFLDATTSGLIGTIIQGTVEEDLDSGGIDPSHGHLGYELSVPGSSDAPAPGAYMVMVTLSGTDVSGSDGASIAFEDSDPIFLMWKSDLSASAFGDAVSAAEALPEPSTAAVVAAVSGGLMMMRRRRTCA